MRHRGRGHVRCNRGIGANGQSDRHVSMHRRVSGGCRQPAFVTQNGPSLNLVNEAGQPSRAWPDALAPTTKIWADDWNVSAVYSPDGMTIQFDNGTIWQRDMGPPPLRAVRVRRQAALR
jgi:hypothetical protein